MTWTSASWEVTSYTPGTRVPGMPQARVNPAGPGYTRVSGWQCTMFVPLSRFIAVWVGKSHSILRSFMQVAFKCWTCPVGGADQGSSKDEVPSGLSYKIVQTTASLAAIPVLARGQTQASPVTGTLVDRLFCTSELLDAVSGERTTSDRKRERERESDCISQEHSTSCSSGRSVAGTAAAAYALAS